MLSDKLKSSMQGAGMNAALIRGSIGSIGVRIAIFSLSLLMAVVLARTLGVAGYGVYAYVMAIVTLLAIPAQVGLPTIVVRETARAQAESRWGLMLGLWYWTGKIVFALSALFLTAGVFTLMINAKTLTHSEIFTTFFGLLLIPIMSIGNLRGAALRGLRLVIQGQLPENILRPAFLVMFLIATYTLTSHELTPELAMAFHCLAAGLAFIIGAFLLWRARPIELTKKPNKEYERKAWKKSIIPLSFIAGASVINAQADTLLLGIFGSAEDVGLYRVAASAVLLINFGKQSIVAVISPYLARLYTEKDLERLQSVVTKSTLAMFLMALPAFLLFAFWGDVVIELIFGSQFSGAYLPLVIMSAGYLFGVSVGSVAALLNMTGYERYTARGVAISAVVNIALNIILIPKFGIVGASIATAVSVVVSSCFLWFAASSKVGVSSGIVGRVFNILK
jgi:O-antigen/teichoic acid export membrane protein